METNEDMRKCPIDIGNMHTNIQKLEVINITESTKENNP